MVDVLHLYMDDSGSRHPDHKLGRTPKHGYDWFGLGGILVRHEDENVVRRLHADFCARWKIEAPLRSADIRARSGPFHWLQTLKPDQLDQFHEELYQLLARAPLLGIACTVDRPGYNHRYREKYGRQRWPLCKTAFSVAVERSAKYARSQNRRLKIYVERCDKKTDRVMRGYYDDLRKNGMPFGQDTSDKYGPLTAEHLRHTLYDFGTKNKSSPMDQLADLYLWPMCMGGYDKSNRPYARLMRDRKLIDATLNGEDIPALGIKYSCFDLVTPKN